MQSRQDLLENLEIECIHELLVSSLFEHRGKPKGFMEHPVSKLKSHLAQELMDAVQVSGELVKAAGRMGEVPVWVSRDFQESSDELRGPCLTAPRLSEVSSEIAGAHAKFERVGTVQHLRREHVSSLVDIDRPYYEQVVGEAKVFRIGLDHSPAPVAALLQIRNARSA